MPTAPPSQTSVQSQALYQATLREAAAGGGPLMGKLVAAARLVLQSQEAAARDLRVRDALTESANLLRKHEQQLCKQYPEALALAFANPQGSKHSASISVADVQFDQLELMDDAQVQSSVSLARVQQGAMLAAEASLADLNTLMCSVLGMRSVRAGVNPLRPEAYVNALNMVVGQTQLAAAIQTQWINAMSATLGQELRAFYVDLCRRLRKGGVVSVMYAMPSGSGAQGAAATGGRSGSGAGQAHAGNAASAAYPDAGSGPSIGAAQHPFAASVRGKDETLLTLDKLRKLLSGEFSGVQAGNRVEQFAAQFAQQFDGAAPAQEETNTDFANTVPAALEALTEMKQVERVVQSLEQRRTTGAVQQRPEEDSIEGQRLALRRKARDMGQALSLEVVTLMVDNMAHDARLLEPVRQVIRDLEPALLRLALVDQRFFTDKQHPARRLLQELTHHSMAFDSTSASGFDSFVQHLQQVLAPLLQAPIDSAEVFEQQLASLQQAWDDSERSAGKDREAAVEVLQHAEARNLLAEKIAKGIEAHPDSAHVPAVVIDFLCGPWAQVVAQTRIKQGAGSAAAEKFEALIPALLWSAHPELARANPAKLTRVVPRLLGTLREGLDTIHYPGTRTSVFLEALMAIHQQVFHAVHGRAVPEPQASNATPTVAERMVLLDDGDPWIAPEEAAASNFVELLELPDAAQPADAEMAPDMLSVSEPQSAAEIDMPLGSWVELWASDHWVRTQLTWASPHGTLYLFTGAYGNTQSMSRRSRDKLLTSGKLRLISGQPVDQGALDAVAQVAMLNSVHSSI